MLAWYLLHTSGDPTKLAATLPALRATASLLTLQTPAEARHPGRFVRVLMSSSQHHTHPGHSQPRDRTINPISQMRGGRHREVDRSQSNLPTTSLLPWFPSYSQTLQSSPDPLQCAVPTLQLVVIVMEGAHCSPSFSSVHWQLNVLFLSLVQKQFHASHCVAYLLQLALSAISDRREGLSCP